MIVEPDFGTATATEGQGARDAAPQHLGNVVADCLRKKTDASAAAVFAERARGKLLFNFDDNAWMHYVGTRWDHDRSGRAMAHAKDVARYVARVALDLEDDDERRAGLGYALVLESKPRLEAMIALAKDELPARNADFDRDPFALNVENGTLDLRTGERRKHSPADRIAKLARVVYDPTATCPRWLRFLEEIMLSDESLIDYLQRFVGYSLTGDVREHVFPILHGGGANGKSTFVETIKALMGDYAVDCDVQLFIALRERGATPEVARLKGARLATASELPEGRQLAERKVKALTGGDRITARHLYGEFFDFHPSHKLLISTNHKPVIRGEDDGIWRRVKLVTFAAHFEGPSADPDLKGRLENELPGILAWAVAGCMIWQRDGLPIPEAVKSATAAYRAASDVFAIFVADCCVVADNCKARADALYDAYKAWHGKSGENPRAMLTVRAFRDKVRERGFDEHRNNGVVFGGIGLLDLWHADERTEPRTNGLNDADFGKGRSCGSRVEEFTKKGGLQSVSPSAVVDGAAASAAEDIPL